MSGIWVAVVGVVGGVAMIIVTILAAAITRQRQARLKADVQLKLIDRFGTADEFVKFINSEEGRDFLGSPRSIAMRGMIGGVRWGIVMACLGIAFFFCAVIEHDRDFYIPAFILVSLGVGFFLSSMVSAKLARQIESNDQRP